MEENSKVFESLLDKAVDYSKTSFELVKLRALDKSSDLVSSLVPNLLVLVLTSSFFLFINLGLAFWFGDLLGRLYYGFFIIAAFYGIVSICIHFFMHKRMKKSFRNFFIQQLLK